MCKFYFVPSKELTQKSNIFPAKLCFFHPKLLISFVSEKLTNYPRCDSNAQPLAPEANALSN